ncbi:Protein FAR1-RELATED SEQUENCE 7 [Linum perenne]
MIDCNESEADFHQQETIPTSNTNDTTADSTENIMNINAAEEPISGSGSGSGSSSSVSRTEIALDKINPKDSSTWEDLRFPTKIDAQGFYKRYARLNGFKVKNKLSQKSGKEGGNEYRYLYFTCNKEGYRKGSELDPKNKGKANTKKVVRKNPETRIGCKANIKLRPTRGANNWFAIFEFNNDHNHSCAQDKHNTLAKQAEEEYTPNTFNFFTEEFGQSFGYVMEELETEVSTQCTGAYTDSTSVVQSVDTQNVKRYTIFKLENNGSRLDERQITVYHKDTKVLCSCQTFEYCGWMCRHMIRAFDIVFNDTKDIKFRQIPEHYMVKRWTRKAKCGFKFPFPNPDLTTTSTPHAAGIKELSAMTMKLLTTAAGDEKFLSNAKAMVENLIVEYEKQTQTTKIPTSESGTVEAPNTTNLKGLKQKENKKDGTQTRDGKGHMNIHSKRREQKR